MIVTSSPCVLDMLDEFPKCGQLLSPPALLPHRQWSPKIVAPREELPAEAPLGRLPVLVDYLPPVELLQDKVEFIGNLCNKI